MIKREDCWQIIEVLPDNTFGAVYRIASGDKPKDNAPRCCSDAPGELTPARE